MTRDNLHLVKASRLLDEPRLNISFFEERDVFPQRLRLSYCSKGRQWMRRRTLLNFKPEGRARGLGAALTTR